MSRRMLWPLGAVGLLACSNEAELGWSLEEDALLSSTIGESLLAAIVSADGREVVAGPHVVGGSLAMVVRHPNPSKAVDGWRLVSSDETIVAVLAQETGPGQLTAELLLEGVGEAAVQVLDEAGAVVDAQAVRVAAPSVCVVEPYTDLIAGAGPPVGSDGTLALVEGGEVSLVVTWKDAEGTVLTGGGVLSVLLEAAGVGKVRAQTVAPFTLNNADAFTLEGLAVTTAPVRLSAYAGEDELTVWSVDVFPVEGVDALSLETDFAPEAASGNGRARIGWVRVDAFAGVRRVIGAPLVWLEDDVEVGQAAYAELVESVDERTIRVCVRGTAVCDEITEFARLGALGDATLEEPEAGCGCAQGGAGGGLGLGLAALGLLVRRRARGA